MVLNKWILGDYRTKWSYSRPVLMTGDFGAHGFHTFLSLKARPSTNVRIAKMAPFWWLVPLEATMAVSHLEKKQLSWMISLISQIALFWGAGVVIQVDGIYMYIYLFLLMEPWSLFFFVAPTVLICCVSCPLTFAGMLREALSRLGVTKHVPTLLPPCWTKGGCEFYSQLWSRHQHLGSFGCVLSG